MKTYVRLSIEAEAYYSGSRYYEELFLTKELWDEIKDGFDRCFYIHELDGKHSEIEADFAIDFFSESELETYQGEESDGYKLYYEAEQHLREDCIDAVQAEVESLRKIESMTITFKTKDKEAILESLKGYIL